MYIVSRHSAEEMRLMLKEHYTKAKPGTWNLGQGSFA